MKKDEELKKGDFVELLVPPRCKARVLKVKKDRNGREIVIAKNKKWGLVLVAKDDVVLSQREEKRQPIIPTAITEQRLSQ